ALHAAPADQHVLQRVVEGVTHMQAARDVGRRDDNAVRRLGRFRMGAERAGALPLRVAAGFDLLGIVGLVEHLLKLLWPLTKNATERAPWRFDWGCLWGQRRVSRTISRSTKRSTIGGRF